MTQLTTTLLLGTVLFLVGGSILEAALIAFNGSHVEIPTIPRNEQTEGSGAALRYAIMGDSTTVGQGAAYQNGYAVATAQYLARTNTVTWKNLGVSGAKARDVRTKQLPDALTFRADVVLIAVGANDALRMTTANTVKHDMAQTIDALRKQNPRIRIVITGAPAMGTIPRFPWPFRQFVGARAEAINTLIEKLAVERHVTFAPIAKETAAIYRAHPEYFAADKFHPNDQGYLPWVPVLIAALDASCARGDEQAPCGTQEYR